MKQATGGKALQIIRQKSVSELLILPDGQDSGAQLTPTMAGLLAGIESRLTRQIVVARHAKNIHNHELPN